VDRLKGDDETWRYLIQVTGENSGPAL
jgi:hypothetical protein